MNAASTDLPYDYIIVGAGAAGSVLAHRLSERPGIRVLLLEAGADLPPGEEPADVRSVFPLSVFNPRYMWPDTRVHWRLADNSPAVPLPQGRILGGSSTVMGMWALRGRPEDYDEWQQAGVTGWSWQDVLPFFRRLENDVDFGGELHGSDGPIPIRREPQSAWSPFARAAYEEAMARGWKQVDDLNGAFEDGHCAMPNSRFASSRGAAGLCYLTQAVRRRANLTVLTDCTVLRLLTRGTEIRGVSYRDASHVERNAYAHETVLAAGALRTPVMLLRSGIGDEAALRTWQIPVVAHRPGVGHNLQNHAVLYVSGILNRGAEEAGGDRPAASTYLRWSSRLAGAAPGDMAIYVRSYLSWHALGRRLASLAPALQKPLSRGRVTLNHKDPADSPLIEFNFLAEPLDQIRLQAGLALAVELFTSPRIQSICGAPFVMDDPSRLARYNARSHRNAFLGRLATLALDLTPAAGRRLLRQTAATRDAAELLFHSEEAAQFIREQVTGTGHVCGTCQMGSASDPRSVCDDAGRVIGVERLRVADASLMPTVPSGNTHIPVVMVAEKISAMILDAHSGATP